MVVNICGCPYMAYLEVLIYGLHLLLRVCVCVCITVSLSVCVCICTVSVCVLMHPLEQPWSTGCNYAFLASAMAHQWI